MATENRIDRGDFVEVWEGEPTWDDPSVWSSYRVEFKPGTEPYIVETNERTLVERAAAALATNADFLDTPNASITQAQALVQIKALTRQVNGLVRLQLRALDSVDDA
jgi:hypothetical protein